jgi:hypothetical protein
MSARTQGQRRAAPTAPARAETTTTGSGARVTLNWERQKTSARAKTRATRQHHRPNDRPHGQRRSRLPWKAEMTRTRPHEPRGTRARVLKQRRDWGPAPRQVRPRCREAAPPRDRRAERRSTRSPRDQVRPRDRAGPLRLRPEEAPTLYPVILTQLARPAASAASKAARVHKVVRPRAKPAAQDQGQAAQAPKRRELAVGA